MKTRIVIGALLLFSHEMKLSAAPSVQVTLTADQSVLQVGESTLLRVWAEAIDVQPNNGIYAYALDIAKDQPSLMEIRNALQLGEPLDFLSDPGVIDENGLHDIYGLDGGFFSNPSRGVGAPFELLTIEVRALLPGAVQFTAAVAGAADAIGVPDGFLLQQPQDVAVDFGEGATLQIVPEPASLTFLGLGLAVSCIKSRRQRRGANRVSRNVAPAHRATDVVSIVKYSVAPGEASDVTLARD